MIMMAMMVVAQLVMAQPTPPIETDQQRVLAPMGSAAYDRLERLAIQETKKELSSWTYRVAKLLAPERRHDWGACYQRVFEDLDGMCNRMHEDHRVYIVIGLRGIYCDESTNRTRDRHWRRTVPVFCVYDDDTEYEACVEGVSADTRNAAKTHGMMICNWLQARSLADHVAVTISERIRRHAEDTVSAVEAFFAGSNARIEEANRSVGEVLSGVAEVLSRVAEVRLRTEEGAVRLEELQAMVDAKIEDLKLNMSKTLADAQGSMQGIFPQILDCILGYLQTLAEPLIQGGVALAGVLATFVAWRCLPVIPGMQACVSRAIAMAMFWGVVASCQMKELD